MGCFCSDFGLPNKLFSTALFAVCADRTLRRVLRIELTPASHVQLLLHIPMKTSYSVNH